jgi:hypothetical protein
LEGLEPFQNTQKSTKEQEYGERFQWGTKAETPMLARSSSNFLAQ